MSPLLRAHLLLAFHPGALKAFVANSGKPGAGSDQRALFWQLFTAYFCVGLWLDGAVLVDAFSWQAFASSALVLSALAGLLVMASPRFALAFMGISFGSSLTRVLVEEAAFLTGHAQFTARWPWMVWEAIAAGIAFHALISAQKASQSKGG